MTVSRRRHGRVEIATINRPEKRNALNRASIEGIGAALLDVDNDPDICALIITGAGDLAFCAGLDLNRIGANEAPAQRPEAVERYMSFLEHGCGKPVLAAVNGAAVAGGFELMLACDLVVAADHARLGIPEVRRGLIPGAGGTLLPQRVPRAIALELGILGDMITAARAYEVGLVNRVVPGAEVLPTALALAETLAANSPAAVRLTRELMAASTSASPAENWRQIRSAVTTAMAGPDAAEGAAAFLEKRRPVWTRPAPAQDHHNPRHHPAAERTTP